MAALEQGRLFTGFEDTGAIAHQERIEIELKLMRNFITQELDGVDLAVEGEDAINIKRALGAMTIAAESLARAIAMRYSVDPDSPSFESDLIDMRLNAHGAEEPFVFDPDDKYRIGKTRDEVIEILLARSWAIAEALVEEARLSKIAGDEPDDIGVHKLEKGKTELFKQIIAAYISEAREPKRDFDIEELMMIIQGYFEPMEYELTPEDVRAIKELIKKLGAGASGANYSDRVDGQLLAKVAELMKEEAE